MILNSIERIIIRAGSLGILISLCGASIVYSANILLMKSPDWHTPMVAFLIIFFIYNLDHLKGAEADKLSTPERSRFLIKYALVVKNLILSSIVLFIGISLCLDAYYLLIGGALILSGLLYTLPVLPGKKRVKDIPLAKNFYVPFSWMLLLLFSKPFEAEYTAPFWLFFFFVGLRAFISTTTGDIRDFTTDVKADVKTLAILLGKQKTFALFKWLNFLTLLFLAAVCLTGLYPWYTIVLVLPTLYNSLILKIFEKYPDLMEFLAEVYDFEIASYGPLLSLAMLLFPQ